MQHERTESIKLRPVEFLALTASSVINVTLRGEFHGSCIDPARNGEAS
jgi:hypothetical protein